MKHLLLLLLSSLLTVGAFAQLTDDFSDGDLSNNPSWNGATSLFQVNNEELQLNNPNPDANNETSLYLSAPTQGETTWELYCRLDFNPSSSNQTKIYLNADQSDFSADLNGYYVLLGGSSDKIALYKQTANSSSELISSPDDVIDVSEPTVRLRVVRDANDNWELFADLTGGTTFTSFGTANDSEHSSGFYFGVWCDYTSTRADKFFFDDFFLDPIFVDNTPPSITEVVVNDANHIIVIFDEPLDAASIIPSNFSIAGINISDATPVAGQPNQVSLTLADALANQSNYTISSTAEDLAGNASTSTFDFPVFFSEAAAPFDILINEIMADPSPVVALPDAEYVELYNISNKILNLQDYEIASGSSPQSMPDYILLPGEYVVVCDDSDINSFTAAGIDNVVAVTSFNALSNGGDNVSITDNNGQIIHTIDYTDDFYQDTDKDDGGWSLELINPLNPCDNSMNNWRASENVQGGTPGSQNSIYDPSNNNTNLQLLSAQVISPNTVELHFSTALSATTAEDIANYLITPNDGNLSTATLSSPSIVALTFSPSLSGNVVYTVTATDVNDCTNNNSIDPTANTASFQLPPPVVVDQSVSVPGQIISVIYDVNMDANSTENTTHYNLSGVGNPASVNLVSGLLAELDYSGQLVNGTTYELNISNVANTDGTIISDTTVTLVYFEEEEMNRYDLVINEIMPDPSDPVLLPETEYIEIYNRSDKILNLEGFYFQSGTSTSSAFPAILLAAGEYAVFAEDDEADGLENYPNYVGLSNNISLSNAGDDVALYMPDGRVMDAIEYDISWYQDAAKDEGGWSLERINPATPCLGSSNWRASDALAGGTPGEQNSIYQDIPDNQAPQLVYAFPNDNLNLLITLDEAVDAELATDITHYNIDGGIIINNVTPIEPLLNQLVIQIDPSTPLAPSTLYTLTINTSFTDCIGNALAANSSIDFALPEVVEAGDVIFNEILFNPYSGGSDFIELYNNSDKIINIADVTILNASATSSPNQPITTDYLLFPDSYVVLTENAAHITAFYQVEDSTLLIENDLPSMANDFGDMYLLGNGEVIDEFSYSENYHFPLLDEVDGVSLERMNFDASSNDPNNWHSASTTVGYATPTYANSQLVALDSVSADGIFQLANKTFSPDLSGSGDDVLLIQYANNLAGGLVNIKIYDAKGREIRDLIQNELLAVDGTFKWDGTNNDGEKARIGIYVVWIEYFDENGNVKEEIETCVLAGQL